MKITVIILGVVIVILLGVLAFVNPAQGPTAPANTGLKSVQLAISPDGNVQVSSPYINQNVIAPLVITGTVTGGGWFFEASFPVKVVDASGNVLGQGQAKAQPAEAWTSTGTVPFAATITFKKPSSATGTVILAKDNPSGAPQNAETFSVPVKFQ